MRLTPKVVTVLSLALVAAALLGVWQPWQGGEGLARVEPPETHDEPGIGPLPGSVSIRLVRLPCFGPCASYTVLLYENGAVVATGDVSKTLRTSVDPRVVDELVQAFESSGFQNLKDDYSAWSDGCESPYTDASATITSVRLAAGVKTVYYYRGCPSLPELEQLDKLEERVDETVGMSRLLEPPN